MSDAIYYQKAVDLRDAMAKGELTAEAVVSAHLQRIEKTNPEINAIVTLCADKALEEAVAADKRRAGGGKLGPLHGLPVAHKDLTPTAGLRTTYGTPTLKDNIPLSDSLIVSRLKSAGAITIGKTNTPEFGAGSQTFNQVFGATANPYNTSRTCGGSSGGAAAALAAGMIPIADGSDMGGSLRNPASFCNVVGLRPSPGRVPSWPNEFPLSPLPVEGPMARTVEDAALLLSAIAGPDTRNFLSNLPALPGGLNKQRDFRGTRVAFSADFDGALPFEDEVVTVTESARPVFEELGCTLRSACPDFAGADFIFKVGRAALYAGLCGDLYRSGKASLKETLVWNIEQGFELKSEDHRRAAKQFSALNARLHAFMQDVDFVVLPVSQVLPFDIETEFPTKIGVTAMTTYLDWMQSAYFVTVSGLPAISVPCGFSKEGLPVGIQIVGRRWDDWGVLELAFAFQQSTGFWQHHPERFDN